jgi:hypothetical protein
LISKKSERKKLWAVVAQDDMAASAPTNVMNTIRLIWLGSDARDACGLAFPEA